MPLPIGTDWVSPDFLADPYSHYRQLRETAPVYFDSVRECWLLTRYGDVSAVLRDDTRFSAAQNAGNSMLVSDPPDHTRLRTLVNKAFTPRAVQELVPRIHAIVDELLDGFSAGREIDAIADFAYPLPITVIAEMMGVEAGKRDFFRDASQKIAVSLGPIADSVTAQRAMDGRNALVGYFNELIARRRSEPRSDLISGLIAAEERGDFLRHGELLAMLVLLLVGGHETTVNLIGNGLFALLQNPGELERLRADESIEKTAIEEILRYDSPVQYTGRVAAADLELGGERIRAGDGIRMILGSANHDPEVFDDPARLDLSRDPCPHLAFGFGIHFCLGAQLARIEGRIALTSLIRRYPEIRLADENPQWRPAAVLRGLEALPVTL